jgi:ABC-type transport system involved in cytochrome c biogenesis permease component
VEPEAGTGANGPFGSRLVGLGIGLGTVVILVMLPFLIPVTFYVVANVYALTKGTTFSSDTANTGVVLTLLVFSVAVFPVGLAVAIAYVGRALSPKRRRG